MINELNNHKKNDFIKWIITFTMITLLAISVIAIGANVFGKGNNNEVATEEDTNTTTPGVVDVDSNEPTTAEGMNTVQVVNSDLMMLSAKAYSAPQTYFNTQGIQLTATAYPVDSENGGFVWSAKWANSNSTFARGKDVYDYIEIEGDEGSGTQYVTALQPFGEQIIISVSTVYNPNAVATCTVDYSQKFVDTQYLNVYTENFFQNTRLANDAEYLVNPIISGSKQQLIDAYYNDDNIEFSYLTSDIYTMDMCEDEYYYVVTVAEEFYDALESVGIELEEWHSYTFNVFEDITPAQVLNSLCCGKIIPTSTTDVVDYELINKFNEAITLWDDLAIYIEVHAPSEFEEKVFCYNLKFDASLVESVSTYVELNQSGIIF